MRQHLELITANTEQARHAVVIMDGAGSHTNNIAGDKNNLSIIKLRQYSPWLNPIEQVWSWLRQHHLANRYFVEYNDIVGACSDVWISFINDTKRFVQMCAREWLNELNF